ncbi:hypothetical protein THMIRHAM_18590 [Thiomicrorhabdus immobilis]|uniref:SprA-related family protein n=1 Tax=Thiomicrorhabdus immobilis TaxID=2791037 RepID=A0ABM7MF43_9GAMM|nr:hypothetical protein THMIRHAM_18590 [Thiomicrorhabdus immobilis]
MLNSESATTTKFNVNNSVALQTQSAKPVNIPYDNRSINGSQPGVLSKPDSSSDGQQSFQKISEDSRLEREQAKQEQNVQQVIAQLKARDTEVKAHEMAHLSASGGYSTGGMSFTYQTGPDGKRYAIGGEVGIDTSPIPGDPQATLQKAMVIQRAALAPAEPSSQDLKVAQAASQMMVQARVEIASAKVEEGKGSDGNKSDATGEMNSGEESSNRIERREPDDSSGSINPQRQQFDLRMQLSPSSIIE